MKFFCLKKTVVFCSLLMLAIFIFPVTSIADVTSYNARIDGAGVHSALPGYPTVFMTSLDGKWPGQRQFWLDSASLGGNKALATALTAVSSGKRAVAIISGDASPGSLIKVLYVMGN